MSQTYWLLVIGLRRLGGRLERAAMRDAEFNFSRPAGLAGSDESHRGNLPGDDRLSEARIVRSDVADASCRGFGAKQHSRRQGTSLRSRVCTFPFSRQRIPIGTPDPTTDSQAATILVRGKGRQT